MAEMWLQEGEGGFVLRYSRPLGPRLARDKTGDKDASIPGEVRMVITPGVRHLRGFKVETAGIPF
jgi:hypothetical protein